MPNMNLKTRQKHSPNWYWQELGYTHERAMVGRRKIKIVTRPDGSAVDIGDQSHSDQLRAAVRECVLIGMTDIIGDDELKYLESDHE